MDNNELVMCRGLTARLGAHLVQRITVALLEHGQGEILACVYKLFGEAALADIAGCTRLAPHNAYSTPACGHGVPLVLSACGNQHPLLTDQFERIERLFAAPVDRRSDPRGTAAS